MTTKAEPTEIRSTGHCDASPTGAHHWLLAPPSATMAGECKYCHAAREFRPFEDNIGFNNSAKRNRTSAQLLDI